MFGIFLTKSSVVLHIMAQAPFHFFSLQRRTKEGRSGATRLSGSKWDGRGLEGSFRKCSKNCRKARGLAVGSFPELTHEQPMVER